MEINLGSVSSSSLTGTHMPSMVLLSLICNENGALASLPGGVLLVSRMSEFFILACAPRTVSSIFQLISVARLLMKLFSFFFP